MAVVGQLGIGIRRRDMRLIRAPLPAKRDGGIPRILVRLRPRIQGSKPLLLRLWLQNTSIGTKLLCEALAGTSVP